MDVATVDLAAKPVRAVESGCEQRIAVLLPCYNEERTIAEVVRTFQDVLTKWPVVDIYVYDNNSTDQSITEAEAAGAIVRSETRQGKGNVIRRMFADIEADVYVMVDADATYDIASAPDLIEKLVSEQLDMLVGARIAKNPEDAYRSGHQFGNRLLTGTVGLLFGKEMSDMLSGYRVLSRRYVKSFPALSTGFETETELTVHALRLRMPIAELPTPYGARPEGSESKLSTFRDGFRILMTVARLTQSERPFLFYSCIAAACALASLVLAYPIFVEYAATGLVPRFPTAILSTGLMILACLSLMSGVILSTVTQGRNELKRLVYLTMPGPSDRPSAKRDDRDWWRAAKIGNP